MVGEPGTRPGDPARSALVAGREGGAGGRRCDAGGVVGLSGLCAAGVLPHMEPDRYSWLLAGAVTILFGAELLLWQRGRRDR